MTTPKIDQIVQKIDQLPTLPIISQRIQEMLADDNATISNIATIIDKDPPMAAKMLKIVNSSFYGLLNKTSSIDHAMVILGLKEVKNIVLGFSIQKFFHDDGNAVDRTLFWKHAIICSQIAKFLGKRFNIIDDGTFFLSGLVHDIGKMVIDMYFHDEFLAIVESISRNNITFSQAEKNLLGVTHYQIGAKLLQHWRFPKRVVMQVFYHHAPWSDTNYTMESIIVFLANIFTKMAGFTCVADEKQIKSSDVATPRLVAFLQKNSFELDEEAFELLLTQIQKNILNEQQNVMTMFD